MPDPQTLLEAEKEAEATAIAAAVEHVRMALEILAGIRAKTGGSRELSTAQTQIETGLLWIKHHGDKGEWAR